MRNVLLAHAQLRAGRWVLLAHAQCTFKYMEATALSLGNVCLRIIYPATGRALGIEPEDVECRKFLGWEFLN